MGTPILIIVIIVCLLSLGYIIYRRLPDLKNLDITSLPSAKQDETKAKIVQAKLWRDSERLRETLKKTAVPVAGFLKSGWQKAKEKILSWEAQYQAKHQKQNEKPLTLMELFDQAEKFLSESRNEEAERALIDIISKNKESVRAYEMLGDLYLEIKSYDQAEEIFKYLIRLSAVKAKDLKGNQLEQAEVDYLSSLEVEPKLTAYYDDLAQIYIMTQKEEKALDAYLKASSIEPNNPKYLDKVIDLGIKLKDKGLASKTFRRLREINPENAKLDEFREAIEKM